MKCTVFKGHVATDLMEFILQVQPDLGEITAPNPGNQGRCTVIDIDNMEEECGVNEHRTYLVIDNEHGCYSIHLLEDCTRQEMRSYYNRIAEKPGWLSKPVIHV